MFSKLFNKKKLIECIYEFHTRNLTIFLEPGWCEYKAEEEQLDDPLTFMKGENGKGVVQISLAIANNEIDFDINKHLKRNNKSHISEVKKYKINDWTIYEYEDSKDGMFVRYFDFIKLHVHMFVTYTCSTDQLDNKELKEAMKIVKSIKVNSKN